MKLCVLANLYAKKPLDEALAILKGMGVGALTGSIVSLYRYAFHEVEHIRTILLDASAQRFLVALMSIGLVIFALLSKWITSWLKI